jgi:ABC-2 type transport system ATP-binding protein
VPAAEPILRLDRLTRRFGALTAVEGLSFEVGRGELFGLVGPDGAGKTTTLRMLAGVLPPSAGDAVLAGASVAADPEAVKRRTAYMSQRFGLYADLTVSENLRFYADLYRLPRRELGPRLERLFEFSGLAPFRDRLAGKLSGGMKQKLGLSCALLHQPEVLLLDEPTFGVDPVSRRDLWLIVHRMVAEGTTAVVATSYLDEAERFDRLALLDRGRALALDAPDALREGLSGRVFEVAAGDPRRARAAARRLAGVEQAVAFGDRVHLVVATAGGDPEALAAALGREGIADARVRRVEASLEDVFIQRVGAAAQETRR